MAYEKINFVNGQAPAINADNLNTMQEQYQQGIIAAKNVKQSPVVAAVVRSNIYDIRQAVEGEIYFLKNPSLEYEDDEDIVGDVEDTGGDE